MNRIDYRRLGELPGDFACWLSHRLGFTVIRVKELAERERNAFELGRDSRAIAYGRPWTKSTQSPKARHLHNVSGTPS